LKLCIIHINAEKGSEAYTRMIDGIFDQVKSPGTEITHRFARLKRAADTTYAYPYFINSLDVVHRFADASEEGFDGAMVACSGDPGVIQARSVSKIPVVGPMAASMHWACEYGSKFGIVTTADRSWFEAVDMIVSANGLQSRCSGIRGIEIPSKEAFTRGFVEPEYVANEIARQSQRLIEDGANSIVIASAGLSCIAAVAGLRSVPQIDAPIFDVLTIGLKTLEMRVDLTKKAGFAPTSRVGIGEYFKPEDTGRVKAQFNPL
jgi:allantoin racemase